MTFGGISFGGLASGLDTGAIIDALLRVEQLPITALENKKADAQTKISLFGTFEGLVRDLKKTSEGLGKLTDFLSFTVTPELEGFATFGATGSAVAGSHTLEVTSLAASDRWAFDPVTDPTVSLDTGPGQGVQFTYDGTAYDVTVAQGASSLNDIAAAINTQAGGNVNATVVNTGTGASPGYQLVLAGKDTGQAYGITGLTTTIGGLPSTATQLTTAADAVAVIDGLTVRRSTNDFSDVIPGVSISVTSLTGSPGIGFTVEADKDAIRDKVQEFVDAYNGVADFINTQNTYEEEGGAGGPLFGDNLLRSVQQSLRRVLFNVTDTSLVQSGYGTLSQIGISPGSDGRLDVDQAKLDEKLDQDLALFADLFVDTDGFDNAGAAKGDPAYYVDTTADSGLADLLGRELDRVLNGVFTIGGRKTDGRFKISKDALTGRIKRFDEQIEQREYRLTRTEENLIARFTALENLMAQLSSQQGFLTSSIASQQN